MLHIPLLLRLSILGIGIVITLASLIPVLEDSQSRMGVTTIILLILLLAGSLYEERWTFDPGTRTISFRFGLLFLAKTMRVSFDRVDEISVERAVRGKVQHQQKQEKQPRPQNGIGRFFRPKVFINLVLYLKDSERLIIESGNARKEEQLINLKKQIQEILF